MPRVVKTVTVTHPFRSGTTPVPLTQTWAYDSEGNRNQMVYPYSYSTAGSPQEQTATLSYTLDSMERPTALTDTGSNTVLANGVTYNAANQITQMTYLPGGYQATDSRTYNTLLQPTAKTVNAPTNPLNMIWSYTAGQNNGQIASQTNAVSGETVTYVYDTLKRLSSATAGSWGESFVYDGFGNLLQKNATKGSPPTIAMTLNTATNQITAAGGSSYGYDSNGNMLYGPTLNNTSFSPLTYDFRNRVTSFPNGSTTMDYGYDASNRRVWKATANSSGTITAETYYLYDLDGTQLAELFSDHVGLRQLGGAQRVHDRGAPVSGGNGGGLAQPGRL